MEKNKIKNNTKDMFNEKSLHSFIQSGFWIIDFFDDNPPRMYCDENLLLILGLDKNQLSPEKMYSVWFERIDNEYIDVIKTAFKNIENNKKVEVKYPWNHPRKGWIWIRCGGQKDQNHHTGSRFKGYNHNITDQLDINLLDKKHKIVDLKKLKFYSSYFIENCEELFEIDTETLEIKTIFFREDKYNQIQEGGNVFSTIKECIYTHDINMVEDIFSPESLNKIINDKEMKIIEFRTKTKDNDYIWVEARLFLAQSIGMNKLLFYTYDISDRKKVSSLTKEKDEILDAFFNLYSVIVEVDLNTELLCILKSMWHDSETSQRTYTLDKFFQMISKRISVDFEKEELKEFLKLDHLKFMAINNQDNHMDFRVPNNVGNSEWIRLKSLYLSKNKEKLYLVFNNVDREHILNSITEKFVYKNSDYLYYVDTQNDYFLNFTKNDKNVTLPPLEGNNYVEEMTKYAKKFVVLEDQNRVIEMMQPEYMLERLKEEDLFEFKFSMLDKNNKYQRKKISIQFYDEENKILLLRRNDVTKDYLNQKKQENIMAIIEKAANTDALTGIYNRVGAQQLIMDRLRNIENEIDAFLIIDLDNFKKINDNFGHMKGDKVLQRVGNILKDNFRKTDIIARLGGDEFIIYMKNVRNKQNVADSVKNLLNKLKLTYQWKNESILISASVGIAITPIDGLLFEELYQKADKALYRAKKDGKNNYNFYQD